MTKWSMAEMIKDQMLEDEIAKDKMGEDEVDINRTKPSSKICYGWLWPHQ